MPKESKEKSRPVYERWFELDLTTEAEQGRLKQAFYVDEHLANLAAAWSSGQSIVMTGEAGVGKTAVLHEWIRRSLTDDDHPLSGLRVHQFSIRHCASTLAKGESIGALMLKLVGELVERENVVPYFRDFHLVWRYDLEPQFELLSNRMARPYLAEGESRWVDAIFEHEPELASRFAQLKLREPRLSRAREIVTAWAAAETVPFRPQTLELSLQLSHRFLTRGRLPRKCLEPLVKLADRARVEGRTEPISESEVLDLICKTHGLPRVLVDLETKLDLHELQQRLTQAVLGQDEAVAAMLNMISRIKAGLIDPRRPFGVFLFVGPTGVGKTHLARLLAESLFGSDDQMVRLNMADYPDDHHAATVFGDPDGRSLSARQGVLAQRLAGQPLAVVLLDEFEKASPKLHDRFLQLFDEGSFVNAAGETVACRSTVLIATSNAGAEVWRERGVGFNSAQPDPASDDPRKLSRELDQRLHKHFRFEFLNRFDQVVHFRPLSREDIRTLATRELNLIEERAGIRMRGLELEVDDSVLDWLAVNGYDPFYGARFLHRTIERSVSSAIADLLLRDPDTKSHVVELRVRRNAVHARWRVESAEVDDTSRATRSDARTEESVRGLRGLSDDDFAARLASACERGRARLDQRQTEQDEYSALLAEMNAEGFWSEQGQGRVSLERFRELDVTLRSTERWCRPVKRLLDRAATTPFERADIAAQLGNAEAALREWDAQEHEGDGQPVWLVLRATDAKPPPEGWLVSLVEMERAWCRQIGLDARLVAYSLLDGDVGGAALEVTGPRCLHHLKMEHGIHRLARSEQRDLRVAVHALPQSTSSAGPGVLRDAIKVPSQLGMHPTRVAKLRVDSLGISEDWFGESDDPLAHLVHDYATALRARVSEALDPARIYAEGGVGARDPRTQATVPRYRDVLKGKLSRLFREWNRVVQAQ